MDRLPVSRLQRTRPDHGQAEDLQKSVSLGKCTRAEAKAKREELLVALRNNEAVLPIKRTLGDWLRTWLDESVKPALRQNSIDSYASVIGNHIEPALGVIRLQELRAGHLAKYYADKTRAGLSSASLSIHHSVISSALKSAVRQGLVARNVAALVDAKPRAARDREQAKIHCWSPDEARTFLKAAADAGPQWSALFNLALDSAARPGELLAFRWTDIDLDTATVVVDRTLLKPGGEPQFGPTKTGSVRTVDLNAITVAQLRQHRASQAELKMKNRTAYSDHGLIFGREWTDLRIHRQCLGEPLAPEAVARAMNKICQTAGLRRIKLHGLRHTSATLLLAAGEPVHVVAARLGHRDATVTLAVYAHALPAHGRQAAQTLGALLHG